ncbi:MAG: substrate-binding domain-containing protein [Sphingomonadales bacterium]|nr:substrate-binding domain-containing protein [Sphingomonadales bacterium]
MKDGEFNVLKHSLIVAFGVGVAAMAWTGEAAARDQIRVVGSSTVFPYSQAVAEEFGNATGNVAPVVESTGTGGGMKIFCQGIGPAHPDATGASRAMKKSEWDECAKNGVTNISEAMIGYDGLSVAHSRKGKAMDLTKRQLYLALAAEVPIKGKLVANPYKTWNQIDAKLPNMAIRVYGPPPTSGTRDAFVELVMEEGCKGFAEIKALDKDKAKEVCARMRQDGLFIEAGENDNLIVQRLNSDPTALGIFGYSFLYENQDSLSAVTIAGVAPTFETIADGSYGISRPIFMYFKNAHRQAIKGFNEFIAEYVSDAALGADGYLHERGLVPLPDAKRAVVQKAMLQAKPMAAPVK